MKRPLEWQLNLFRSKRQRGERPPPAPEFHLQCMVADVLDRWLTPGWIWTHIGHGGLRSKATAAQLKRAGLKPGWPDFIMLSCAGSPYFLELKRRGGQLSEAQQDFERWCVAHNVPFECADEFDIAMLILKRWGIIKVEIST
jgi:VRR-NUC domain